GNSWGGQVATGSASPYPERTAGVVLLGAAGLPEAERDGRPLSLRMLTWPVLGPLLRQLPGRGRVRDGLRRAVYDPATVSEADVDAYYTPLRTAGGTNALVARLRQPTPADRAARVRTIRAPTLVITGDTDRLVPLETARGYHALIAGSELLVLARTRHLPQEELRGLRQLDGVCVERRVDEALRGAEEEPRRGERRRGADGGEQRDREGEEPERGQDDRPPSERVAEPSRADARQDRGRRVGQEEGRDRSEGRVLHEGGDVGDDGAERHPAAGDGRDRRGELRRGPQRQGGVEAGRRVVRQRPGDRQAEGREHARRDEERGEAAQPDELLAERRRERVRSEGRDAEEAEGSRPAPLGRELRRQRGGRVEAG